MTDWAAAPTFPAGGCHLGRAGNPVGRSRAVLRRAARGDGRGPGPPGEEAWYGWLESLLQAAAADPQVAGQLRAAAVDADATLVAELFQFRNIGLPLPGGWSTQRNGARFGTDYLSRTAMAKANIFVNTPEETTYFYQDLDEGGERLHGSHSYALTFPPHGLPPVRGFWSLTLYNEHHFFHPNELNRYSLGTKNKQPAPRCRRVADPDRLSHTARRCGFAQQLAARAHRAVLPVPARLLARAANPRRPWAPPHVTRFH